MANNLIRLSECVNRPSWLEPWAKTKCQRDRGTEGQRDRTDDGMANDECPSTFDTSTKRGLEAGAGIDSITLRAQ